MAGGAKPVPTWSAPVISGPWPLLLRIVDSQRSDGRRLRSGTDSHIDPLAVTGHVGIEDGQCDRTEARAQLPGW